MAEKSRKLWRGPILLAVLVILGIAGLVGGHVRDDAGFTPKLALDLEGGTQVILTPKMTEGSSGTIDQESMNEAINIIRQRIDASGVAEAEISTLGADNIVVSIPGEPDPDTLDLIRTSATMRFRPVLVIDGPEPVSEAALNQSADEPADVGSDVTAQQLATTMADLNGDGVISTEPSGTASDNSDLAWLSEQDYLDFLLLDCADPGVLTGTSTDDPNLPLASCAVEGDAKYLLGPADLEGTTISNASAGMIYSSTGQPTGQFGVDLEFDAEGTKQFADSSQRLFGFQQTDPTRNRFAVVLDGNVISAPSMNAAILDGRAQISGNFTAASAQNLANQLNFGSLPLNFEVQSEQQISATLGSNHLEKGILAGLVGLILVVLWMLWQYRGLTLVSAGSLLVAGGLTYLSITLLSWVMGYRLSLAGVAGLIVAVGITADSFIVYFERIRDEVRDGAPLSAAVERGWLRARRTIVISDAVNLVAASVLYLLAVGGVQGFAFTLGLTTIVDLVVIFLFTHPIMALLMRTRFFGQGNRWSGLDPEHLGAKSGAIYAGRGTTKYVEPRKTKTNEPSPVGSSGGQNTAGLSIAERKRAAALRQKEEALTVGADPGAEDAATVHESALTEGSDEK